VNYEDPGYIRNWCDLKGNDLSYTRFFNGDPIPADGDFDWLVIMGGPMGVYDEDRFPWLKDEKKAVRKAIEQNKTVIGICLGAQILANVLGAKVYKNTEKEIGWYDVMLTREGLESKIMKGAPPTMKVFHWHGDTFKIPAGAKHIVFSEGCRNQAFTYGDNVLALQFHFEVTGENITTMLKHGASELVKSKYVQTEDEILSFSGNILPNNRIISDILDNLKNSGTK
jgi:GMP synthase-like glutamine amidotransferase